jgi:eukaryotic-like serine/threonine-protein kinase
MRKTNSNCFCITRHSVLITHHSSPITRMAECPSDADLAGFLNDTLAPDRLAGLTAHVDGCPSCQTRLDKLTHDANGAVARYKELSSASHSGMGTKLSAPEAHTLVLDGKATHSGPRLTGLPQVPGFDVVEEIGRGGMGVVYKARHRRLNRLCALKMILAGGAADARTVQRFLFEAEILGRVQHSQVVQVFEVDTYQGPSGVPIPYLAMELLEGGSLSRRIKAAALPPQAAAGLIEGIARALHTAHLQGVIHRDLKPGNILFPVFGGQWSVDRKEPAAPSSLPTDHSPLPIASPKVTDFGLAKFTETGGNLTGSGQVVGTPHYMSPEQAAGSKQIGPQADVYSLGAILFECLTGRPPFIGEEPISVLLKVVNESPPDVRTLCPAVSRDLAAVVARCLEKEPRRRYASAEELADDLHRFQENLPTIARPLRRRERLWLLMKRNPVVSVLTIALVVVLMVAFAAIIMLWMRAEQTAQDERHSNELARLSEGRAMQAMEKSNDSLAEANRQKINADRRQAELEFGRAMSTCEEGRVHDGLRQFVRVVDLAEQTGAADLARVARMNLAAWPRELSPQHRAFLHREQPRLAAFHPDGKQMVTVGRNGEAFLWDIATGEKVRTYKSSGTFRPTIVSTELEVTYWSVAISPDGNTIAAGGSDGKISVWNTDSPALRVAFDAVPMQDDVWSVGFAPDGTLWAADGKGGVKQWNLATRPRPTMLVHLEPPPIPKVGIVNVIAVSSDGSRVYTGDRRGIVREWDTKKRIESHRWETNGWVQDLAISADGTHLASTGPPGDVSVIDLRGNKPPLIIGLGGAYGNGVAFAPKRPFVVASDGDGNVRFWHRDTGQPIGIPIRFSGEVTRMRFCPNTDQFAVPAGNAVYLCALPDPPGDLVSAGHGIRIRGLDFSPTGNQLAIADDSFFEVFDLPSSKRIQAVFTNGADPRAISFDPDPARSQVYRGNRDTFDRIDVPKGANVQGVLNIRLGQIARFDYLPGDKGLLALGTSLLARYNRSTLEFEKVIDRKKLVPDGIELHVMAARRDGGEILLGYGNKVAFLSPETLEPIREGWSVGDDLLDAKYTPDGSKVFIARRDNVAELVDARTGVSVMRPMPHSRVIAAVAVSPDGKTLLTGSRDGTARFWDAASGLPIGSPLRHLGPVTHVVYSPMGDHVATGTGTGHVMLWDVPPPAATGSCDELRAEIKKRE